MSRLLVLGHALPRHDGAVRKEAHSYRTWQIVEPLVSDGHTVRLAAVDLLHPSLPQSMRHLEDPELDAWIVNHRGGLRRSLRALHDEFAPEAVIAVGQLMSLAGAGLRSQVPRWCDLYGDPLFEWQAAMSARASPRGLRTALGLHAAVLRYGDVFSAVSDRQADALRGRLALLGRANHLSAGYEFVHSILPGASPHLEDVSGAPVFRGTVTPPDAFVALWVGGYNVWCDPETLYTGLEQAMAVEPALQFVSVGGAVVNEAPYGRLQELIANSRYRDRFHLLGWRKDRSEVLRAYREADVGLSVDLPIYETRFGSRTRLVEMLQYGLPVLASEGCDLVELLRQQRGAVVFPSRASRAFAEQLVALARDPERLQDVRARGRALVEGQLSFMSTTEALRRWARAPRPAPDRGWRRRWNVTNTLRWWWRAARWRLTGTL